MARIDRVRESYEQTTERLFSDKTAFEQYLKFAGRFFKVSSEQSMIIYGTNPKATMVADYDTWKKFSRRVKRGTNSIAVLDNGNLKHYFDVLQTTGSTVPYQWTLDKETANAIINETFEKEGKHFSSFSGCVNYLGSEKARGNIDSVVRSLNISDDNRAAFEKSYISMTQYFIAARCEMGGSFKYNGNLDLSALDMLHSKAEKEKLCEFVQLSGKSVLLSMEKSIHEIELQRRNNYGRNQANLVRGGQDVLSRNQGGERQTIQAGQGNIRVPRTDGTRSDGGRAGVDERADRTLGYGMAEVYDGKSPRSNSVPERSAEMGADTPTDRQGGYGISDAPEETVRTEKSPSENIRGNTGVGEHSRNDNRQGDSGGHSTSISGISEKRGDTMSHSVRQEGGTDAAPKSEHKATYSTENNEQTAEEEKASAVSVSDDISDLLTALKQHREIYFEDEPEQMIANANRTVTTNRKAVFDEDLGKFILRGDYHYNGEVLADAWLFDKDTAEEMEQLIKQNGYKIRGYGEQTAIVPDNSVAERNAELAKQLKLGDEFLLDGETFKITTIDGEFLMNADNLDTSAIRSSIAYIGHWRDSLVRELGEQPLVINGKAEEKSTETQTEVKAAETPKRERSASQMEDFRFVEEKTREFLRSASDTSTLFPYILSEMNESSDLAERAYEKVFAYCYEEKIPPQSIYESDLLYMISDTVDERVSELRESVPLAALKDIDKFYVNEENQSVIWAYFNPDSSAGGQLVYHTFTYDQLFESIIRNEPVDYLEQVSKTELVDVSEPNFKEIAREFLEDNESFSSRGEDISAKLSALVEPRFAIFQLKGGEELRDYRFRPFDSITADGMYVDRENYDRVYRGRMLEGETLEDLYVRFNISHPDDFSGHSLSVSDIICVKENGRTTAHYIDNFGFKEIPDFTLSLEERKVRRVLTDNLPLLADNQLASDEMDTLGDKLFRYEQAPKYKGTGSSWLIGAGMTADKFEDITTRYHNGEDVRAELAKGMYGNISHISFYEHYSDGISGVDVSSTKSENGITFRTKGGFEITHSWETLGEALITAARKEFDRHEELDRQYREQEEKSKAAEKPSESTIHFGLLGNGITCYDVSRQDKDTHDFVTVAHISNEGNVSYWVNDVSENDKKLIEAQAVQRKQEFTEEWNKLPLATRYERILNEATPQQYGHITSDSKTMSSDELVKKYEHSVIFKDEETPVAVAFQTTDNERSDISAEPDEVIPETDEEIEETEDFEEIPDEMLYDYRSEPVQLNLFGEPMEDVPERKYIGGVDIEEALKHELIQHGTGFQDGKFRIEKFYRENNPTTIEFAKFVSKEFGIGGHSGDGKIDGTWYDGKGIKLDFKLDNGEKTSVTWSWQKVASRLATLIDNQTYITQRDIDNRIRNARYEVANYDTDSYQYQSGMKVLDEYGLTDNGPEQRIDTVSAESETAEQTTDIKNLAQLKRLLTVGAEFEITSAFRPEVVNQLRKVNYADTTGIYSIRPDAPDDRVTLANNGRGSYLAWGKSADWSFENGYCTAYNKDSEHTPENVIYTLKVKPRVIEKEHTAETVPEQEDTSPKLNEVVIDLTPRSEREEIPVIKHDFTITDEHLGEGGQKAKYNANIAAIRTLKTIESESRLATPDEQAVLAKYVGWGGIPQTFDSNNTQWKSEYKELRELLTDEEYTAAKGSVLNAHYTSPTVINAIYKGLETLGFEGGNILEPAMGVGNFFGVMPEDMRQNSHLHGVELDSISGRIAQQLYQTADIQIKGYEKTEFSDNFFDAAVGNVPFGSYGVSDKRYNRENFFIHDYFLAKTLDKLAPNGIAALITTKGTMDKENPKVREYLARRGDLIGAIRLPNNAFKANAGTEVTTDILFFQKREKMAVEMPDWCYVGKNADGVPVNNYFIEHPEMVLGTMKQGLEFSLYGNAQETACVAIEGADLKEQLEQAVSTLKLNNAIRKHSEQRDKEAGVIPATADVRNFTFAEVDGKMYFRENNIMTEVTETGKRLDKIKALNELRSTFREMLTAQEENCSDETLSALQAKLNTQYDRFVKQYGYINDNATQQVFGKDDDYNSLCALEIIDEENKTVEKSDFFTKRTVKYIAEITRVDTPQEAMQVSIDTKGTMDIPYMAQLCDLEPQEIIDVLKADNLIYLNPLNANEENALDGWEETSEYLSGNVRAKLKAAELYAKETPEFQRNVEALTSVLPPKLEAGDISARIGVSWVDVEDYQQFLTEYAKARFFEPIRRTITGEYKIDGKNWDSSAAATQIYGTSRMNAKTIFENLLNNRDVVVRDKITDPDGREHYEINKKETDLAQDKARQMKEAFKRWLWEAPERREKYVERYNNLFNCIVGRKFDGSHQTFPGMSPSIALKPHQLDAVMRAKFGGNTLLAHCVGAGKSFEMVAATMEKKRLGLINKACVVVPKHLVGQMANEWLRLYPQAKILTATEKDFDKNHRQKFIGRCCTGDYDAVIMSYEQFEKIPMSMEYRQNFIQREIDTLQSGIDELSGDYRSRTNNRSSIKDLEREKKRLETRLNKLIEGGGKTKDTSLTFEQLGFDSIVVDEAHNYKNGLVVSKMNRVSGVQTTPAQKSEDILMKTQFLNENYGEKNIIFATGTPVSNSMTELYIMQRYLRPSLLANAGLQTFDDWASNFGEVVSKAELKPAGNGYRTKKRFAKFNNVPELMQMYKEFADIRTADMLNLPVPEIEGGKPQTIVAKPNDVQKAYMQVLAERSEAIHSGAVDPAVDNMLKITNEARLLGLDARCIMQNAENYPDSKVNLCINKIMEIYEQTAEQKGVQAIFCDIAVNSDDGRFSVYDYIKEELIRRGIPENEICKAGDAETQKQRNEMYAQLRSGTKRIVLASTSKMGTGANIQTKLAALHNLDIPWKPSDIEQRNGRIIRQGNEFGQVGVYNYVTENTFDAYLMNIIVTKQRFISQLMNGDTTARSCEDVDEAVLNYSEMQALASGDERIKEKIELDGDVARLRLLESEHYNAQYRLDDTIRNAEKWISNFTANIEAAKADIAYAAEHKPLEDDFKIEIGGKVYTERKAAGEALQKAAIKVMAEVGGKDHNPIGTFCGFEFAVEKIHNGFTVGAGISLRHKLTYTAEMDITGDIGNITRLENLFNKGLDKKLSDLEDRLSRMKTDLQEAQAAKGKPFEHAEELATKSARLEQLNRELEVGQVDEVIMDESEDKDETKGSESHDTQDKNTPDNKPTPPKHNRH